MSSGPGDSGNDFSSLLSLEWRLPARVSVYAVIRGSEDVAIDGSTFPLPTSLRHCHYRRQHDFLVGRFCARRALLSAGHGVLEMLPVGTDQLPVWPEGWRGSISHSAIGAVAVVTGSQACLALGVDTEPVLAPDEVDDVASLVASEEERYLLKTMSAGHGTILLFSAKEALYKALFPLFHQFQDFDAARLVGMEGNCVFLKLTKHWGTGFDEGKIVPIRYAFTRDSVYTVAYC